jgi:hypothetical protein
MTQIERLLAQCLYDLERGASVEECLARHPERREELEPLLRAAQRVRSAPRVAPAASFRQDARARMLNKIQAKTPAKATDRASRREGLLDRLRRSIAVPVAVRRLTWPALATITIIVLVGTTSVGVVYASSKSLPGDSLYPVKLASERVRLALSAGDSAEARLHLRLADERLREVARLAQIERDDESATLLRKYVEEIQTAGRILRSQYAEGRDVTLLAKRLREHVVQQQAVLASLQEELSEGTQPAVERAMAASIAAEKEAAATTEEEPPASPTNRPTSTLTATVTATPSPTPSATAGAARTPAPTHTDAPSQTPELGERLAPTETPQPRGQTKTPQPPGQTNTPQSPGHTNTPQPPGQTNTPQPPGQTNTPQPPGQTNTPQLPGQTNTPQPPGQTNTPQPPGQTNTPQPPGQTNTPQPSGQTSTPQPPGQTKTPKTP